MKITPFARLKPQHREVLRRPVNVLASALTITSLYCGTMSIFASIGLEFEKAAYFILAAIIFDSMDGTVARLTKSTSEFGKELDSLCDQVSFGVAPAVLVFMAYLPDGWHLPFSQRTASLVISTGSYMAIFYVICTALRLARYNTYQATKRDYFTGLPSPAAGGMLAAFVLFLEFYQPSLESHRLGSLAHIALGPMAVLLAVLMVSNVRYPKDRMKSFVLSPKYAFQALGMGAFVIVLVHWAVTIHPSIILFPLGASYVLFGIGDTLYTKLFVKESEVSTDSDDDFDDDYSEEPVSDPAEEASPPRNIGNRL